MEFVVDNYLWFLIGGIVLLMIIIGYFAEKTNFGKLPLNNKKKQTENNEEQIKPEETETKEEMKLDEIGIADALAPEENFDAIKGVEEPLHSINEEEDLNVPFGDVSVPVSEDITSPSETIEEVATVSEVPNAADIIETNEENTITDEADDDVWKF